MAQFDYLEFSEDGKTVIRCDKDYAGTVFIPRGVTGIYFQAFENCANLTTILISQTVSQIGVSAFARCPNLKEIGVIGDSPYFCSDDGVLYSKSMLKLIAVPQGKNSVEIPNSVTTIESSAFENCSRLSSIKIPKGVQYIPSSAFSGCSSLASIEIPSLVVEIGDKAFLGCKSLTSIAIPDRVSKIGDEAFLGCESLTSIEIPNSVKKIGTFAFAGCAKLTSIVIPENVTKIGENAFFGCNGIKKIHLKHWDPVDFFDAFMNTDVSQITIYVPEGKGWVYQHHGFYCRFQEIIEEE